MESNKTKIKRMAQFLFDNAGLISDELQKTDNYRNFQVEFAMFKSSENYRDMRVTLAIYDEKKTHYKLENDTIYKDRFKLLCKQMNEDVGVEPLPEPVKVRVIL